MTESPVSDSMFTHCSFVTYNLIQINMCCITDGPKDTSPEDTLEKTYTPSLKTLEEDVMEKMNIQEPRRPRRSFWY